MNKKTLSSKKGILIATLLTILIVGSAIFLSNYPSNKTNGYQDSQTLDKLISGSFDKNKFKTDKEWKKILTPEQYYILRQKGTEVPFSGSLDYENRKGTYFSVGCSEPVFRSEQKYDSKTGWPSFWDPISPDALVLREDNSLVGEKRIEVLDKCGGHLGHLFEDGPQPTGKRYCMNSVALKFIPDN